MVSKLEIMTLTIGYLAEAKARRYLESLGARFIQANYRCKLGEIDLIMWDQEYLVFVEVRSRKSIAYGRAIESVTKSKQNKIIKSSNVYLMQNKLYDIHPIRFDIVTLEGVPAKLEWVKGAFYSDW